MEVQPPTEQNLLGEESVRLGRDWPTEHDDTTHLKRGYYRRDNGSLGKVVDGVKLTESEDEDEYSSSAKRAKMGFCASESDSSDVRSPKVGTTKDDKYGENAGEGAAEAKQDEDTEEVDEEKTDTVEGDDEGDDEETEEVDVNPFFFRGVCRQTVGIDDDGNEEECGGETDGRSQMCHSCKQAMKRGWFAYGVR